MSSDDRKPKSGELWEWRDERSGNVLRGRIMATGLLLGTATGAAAGVSVRVSGDKRRRRLFAEWLARSGRCVRDASS